MLVTVGVRTVTTTMTITTHPVMASAAGIVFVTTRALPGTGAPLLTVATLSMYAGSAYSPYANHFPHARLASPCQICEDIGQPIHADSVMVYLRTYVGRDSHAGAVRLCMSDGVTNMLFGMAGA